MIYARFDFYLIIYLIIFKDNMLRQSCLMEEHQKSMRQQAEESEIALAGLEGENKSLRYVLCVKFLYERELTNNLREESSVNHLDVGSYLLKDVASSSRL